MSRRDDDARRRRLDRETKHREARLRSVLQRLDDLKAKVRLQVEAPIGEDLSEGMREVFQEIDQLGREINALEAEAKGASINAFLGHDQITAGDAALANAGRFEAAKEPCSCACPVVDCGALVYEGPFDQRAIVAAARAHSVEKHEGRGFLAIAVDVPARETTVLIESDDLAGDVS